MLDTNTYFSYLNNFLILDKIVQEKIEKNIDSIKQKIWGIFQDDLYEIKVFGSFGHDLFIAQDKEAALDILVVFKSKELNIPSILTQIKNCSEEYFTGSNIITRQRSITIEIENLKFDIVPAIFVTKDAVKIPAPGIRELKWILSKPSLIQDNINLKDNTNKGLIKPLIRIMKYWNTLHLKPFASYELEMQIANKEYDRNGTLRDYFYDAALSLKDIVKTEKQKVFVSEIKERIRRLRVLESYNIPEYIEVELSIILPTDLQKRERPTTVIPTKRSGLLLKN